MRDSLAMPLCTVRLTVVGLRTTRWPWQAWHLCLMADASAAALVALHLHLLEHTRRKLVPHDLDAAAVARGHCSAVLVGRAGTIALLADLLLVPLELGHSAVVEVAQRDFNPHLDVRAAALALAAEVTTAAEEAAEEVEGIVGVETAAPLLLLLQALVTIFVVDLCGSPGSESASAGFGDLDELILEVASPLNGAKASSQSQAVKAW